MNKRLSMLKRKLNKIENSIRSCNLRGFSTKKLMDARSWYICEIKKIKNQ